MPVRYHNMSAKELEHDSMFHMEELDRSQGAGSPEPPDHCPEMESEPAELNASTSSVNEDIELSRRALPVVEVEEDVCSICLDDFTGEDPFQQTSCG